MMHTALFLTTTILLFFVAPLIVDVQSCGFYDEYGNFWTDNQMALARNNVYNGRRRRDTPYDCAMQTGQAQNSFEAWPNIAPYNNGFGFNGRTRRALDASQREQSFAAGSISRGLLQRILSSRKEQQ